MLQNGIQNFLFWLIHSWEITLQSQIFDIFWKKAQKKALALKGLSNNKVWKWSLWKRGQIVRGMTCFWSTYFKGIKKTNNVSRLETKTKASNYFKIILDGSIECRSSFDNLLLFLRSHNTSNIISFNDVILNNCNYIHTPPTAIPRFTTFIRTTTTTPSSITTYQIFRTVLFINMLA